MFMRSVAMGGLVALSFTGMTPAKADIITIDATYQGNNHTVPVVKVSLKDKDGNVIMVKAAIDTGNSDTTTISSDLAAQLGITSTGTANQKSGGGQTAVQTGSLAGNAASVAGADGKSAPLPNAVAINPNLPNGTMILGGDFLNSFGDWDLQKKKGKVVLTKNDEVSDLNLPLLAPLYTALAEGTVTDPGDAGPVPVLDVSLASGSASAVDPFVVSTWYDSSLISMSTAEALGIDLSGLPTEDVETYAGDISVPFATVDLGIFAGQPLTAVSLGILSDDENPLDENILGTDVLSGFDEFDINMKLGEFEAVPASTPEASSLVLLLTGIAALGIAGLGRRRLPFGDRRRGDVGLPGW